MNKLIRTAGFAIMLSIGLISCEKENLIPWDEVENAKTDHTTTNNVMAGTWVITQFEWHNKEENNHFDEYQFRFSEKGIMYALFKNNVYEGTWARRDHDFKMDFGAQEPLRELNGGWNIVESGDGYLVLKGLNQNDGSSQFVVFRRLQ